MRKFDLQETIDYIANSSAESKIYLGGDSCRFKKYGRWQAEYTICVVIHIDGNHGCKVFGYSEVELDFDQNKNKPKMRLMNEVMKVCEFYNKLHDAIGDRACEIHLDLNHNPKFGSNCVVKEATGYVRAMCNMEPKFKPFSPAASFMADRLTEILQEKKEAA